MNAKTPATLKPNPLNPRLIFEAALADLNDEPRSARAGRIALRPGRPLRACTESVRLRRERALNEAANALAKLWKR
jgi:hypothetical protein